MSDPVSRKAAPLGRSPEPNEMQATPAAFLQQIEELQQVLEVMHFGSRSCLEDLSREQDRMLTLELKLSALRDELRASETALRDELRSLERELEAARQLIRQKDLNLQAIYNSTSWALLRPIRGLFRFAKGELGFKDAAYLSARGIYRALPIPGATRHRLRGHGYQGLRFVRALKRKAPTPAEQPSTISRGAVQELKFPLPGYVAALPELQDEIGPPLDASVSVVIPTYNAGSEFYWLVRKLRAQKGLRDVEVVVVDSGSTDGTDILAEEMGCRVIRIDKSQFSHSYARNMGADNATGDLILFMVQDAYPVGDHWLYALASCLLHPRSKNERLAALSCAEFPRSDTELLYNASIDTHYKFLGCHAGDRIGQLTGEDNLSLRTQGQLSDVACLIPRSLFAKYRYQGRYAEDLILGIRLIRDGHKIGMLSSVKVIHSHNRPASYYVRRVFVDVIFLTDVFPDFDIPKAGSIIGTMAAAHVIRTSLEPGKAALGSSPAEVLERVIKKVRSIRFPRTVPSFSAPADFGFHPLGKWVEAYAHSVGRRGQAMTADDKHDLEQVRNMFVDRLTNLQNYVEGLGTVLDERLAKELDDAVEKTLAMTVGAQIAFIYLNVQSGRVQNADPKIAELKPMLLAGI